jgi:hypothetical protein
VATGFFASRRPSAPGRATCSAGRCPRTSSRHSSRNAPGRRPSMLDSSALPHRPFVYRMDGPARRRYRTRLKSPLPKTFTLRARTGSDHLKHSAGIGAVTREGDGCFRSDGLHRRPLRLTCIACWRPAPWWTGAANADSGHKRLMCGFCPASAPRMHRFIYFVRERSRV